ncbi:MAG: DUF389 domain-containing protein [Alphaproteobacteria bacterium]|nr:DUF389 domain-containing protein [Alphaproteobacteria bacterium]
MSRVRRSTIRTAAVLRRAWRGLTGGWAPYTEQPVPAEDLSQQMVSASVPAFAFFFMLAIAAAIATFGLIANSAPAIIGAMIIAPLMSPIMGLSYGLVAFDRRLISMSLVTVAAGTVLVVAIAYLSMWIIGMRVAGSEILARTSPTLLDLGVALAAGGAAAFVHTRRSIANSIAGVAIAVALVPPLAVTGIGLALGEKATSATGISLGEFGLFGGGTDIATGSFVLFLTNLVGIVAVAMLVFLFQRYGAWKKALVALILFAGFSFLIFEPLDEALREMYVKNRVLRLSVKLAATRPDLISGRGRIEAIHVDYRNGVVHVSMDGFVPNAAMSNVQDRMDKFQGILAADIGEPVVLELDIIPVDIVRIRSGPAELKKAAMVSGTARQ